MGRCWRFFLLIITYSPVFQPKKPDVPPFFFGVVTFLGHYDPQLYIFSFLYFNSEVAFFYPQQLTFN